VEKEEALDRSLDDQLGEKKRNLPGVQQKRVYNSWPDL